MRFAKLGTSTFIYSLVVFCVSAFVMGSAVADSGVTYHGRLVDPSGSPVLANVQFKLQIRTPGVENCLLYEETQSQNLSTTRGLFAISLGDGSGHREDSYTWDFLDVLSNRKAFSTLVDCTGSNSYTPGASDIRHFKVYFNAPPMAPGAWEEMPTQVMNFTPFSAESYAVGGFNANSLLRVETAGVLGNVSPLNNTQYAALVALVNGSSNLYQRAGQLNGGNIPALTTGQSFVSNGSGGWSVITPLTSETDPNVRAFAKTNLPTCAAGDYLRNNGSSALECTAPSSGGPLVESDIPLLTSAGHGVNGGAITTGTIGGNTSLNTTGTITSGNITTSGSVSAASISATSVGATSIATRNLIVRDSANTAIVTITAPTTGPYTLLLPPTDGASGQVLTTDGSGVLSWTTPGGGGGGGGNVNSVDGVSPVSVGGTATDPIISVADATGAAKGIVQVGSGLSISSGTVSLPTVVTAATYGSATEVPVITTDAYGRITTVVETPIAAVSPVGSALTNGQVWVGTAGDVAAQRHFGLGDIKTSIGSPQIPTGCADHQTMTWSALTDILVCTNIEIAHTQVTGLGTAASLNTGTTNGTIPLIGVGDKLPSSIIPAATVAAGDVTSTATGNIAATNVQAAIVELESEKVAKNGDTMTGVLSLPANGLIVGTNQLVVSGASVGIGTDTPANKLSVVGIIQSTTGGFRFPDGSTQTTAAGGAWQIITANHTAVAGDNLMVDTSSGAVTVTLPASPTMGQIVKIIDVSGSFQLNNLTVDRNGLNIMSLAENMIVDTQNISFELIYSNATYGWRIK